MTDIETYGHPAERPTATVGRLVLAYVKERTARGELTGTSPETIRKNLWLFAEFVGSREPVTRITKRQIERWLESMEKLAPATRRHRLSHMRPFGAWLVERRYLKVNPAAGIKTPKQPRVLPPRGLQRVEVRAIFDECDDDRVELVVSLMCQEGLRRMEVAGMQLGDVDLARRTMVVTGKGGHQRVLPISDETFASLTAYLDSSHTRKAGPLILSQRDDRRGISPAQVSRIVHRRMTAAGVKESPHSLRHTCASDMLDAGAHVRNVQYALGHQSLLVTERYLRRVVGDLRVAMAGRTYRDGPAE